MVSSDNHFHAYLHKQIPLLLFLSLLPGLGYVFLSWMHGIPLRAVVWYGFIVAISIWGYRIYRNYLDKDFSREQLKVHVSDVPECDSCSMGYPMRCSCGGFVHAELARKICDRCGRQSELGVYDPRENL